MLLVSRWAGRRCEVLEVNGVSSQGRRRDEGDERCQAVKVCICAVINDSEVLKELPPPQLVHLVLGRIVAHRSR